MPNTHTTLVSLFNDIADAIRVKTGSSDTIVADEFPDAIGDISTGIDTSDATAYPQHIVASKTGYARGSKITGTIPTWVPTYNGWITIGEDTLKAGYSQTWAQWVSSGYNTIGLVVSEGYVEDSNGDNLKYNGSNVAGTDSVVIDGVYSIDNVTLINFTVYGDSYQAEENMTWGNWIESDYNTSPAAGVSGSITNDGYYIYYLIDGVGEGVVYDPTETQGAGDPGFPGLTGTPQSPSYTIISNRDYSAYYVSPDPGPIKDK